MKTIAMALVASLLVCDTLADAVARDRTRLPSLLRNTGFGVTVGYGRFPFSLAHLEPGIDAKWVETPKIAIRGQIEHAFHPNLAVRFSLMRSFEWVEYWGVPYYDTKHSVQLTLFGLTVKPTLHLSERIFAYAEGGPAYLVRDGFDVEEVLALEDREFTTALIAAGIGCRLLDNWIFELNSLYVPGDSDHGQPYTFYAGAGLTYRIPPESPTSPPLAVNTSPKPAYYFPLNTLQCGFFDHRLFSLRVNKYFTPPNIPIFWNGDVETDRGAILFYTRNVYHTRRWLSLDWGASVSGWETRKNSQAFYAVSLFPALRLWLIRQSAFDLYFVYSVAGPTYITRNDLDGLDTGQRFTFQDYMGVGCLLGEGKHVTINLKIMHYSNGNLLIQNPGIAIPVVFGLGYSW